MERFKRIFLQITVFSLLIIAYIAWNHSEFLVWDDTAHSSYNIYAKNKHYDIENPRLINFLFSERFGKINSDGYRPLSGLIRGFGTAYFVNMSASLWPFLILNGIVFSFMVFAFYYFSCRFTKDQSTSFLALFLFLASTPFLTGSMIRFAGIFALIPLLFLIIFICYFKSRETHHRYIWFILFIFFLFISPWLRELFLIVPILIIFFEIYNGAWKSRELIIAVALIPHFIFPGAIPHWIAYSDLPIKSIFFMGALSNRLETSDQLSLWENLSELICDVKWRVFIDIFSVFPTTIVFFACLYGIYVLVKNRWKLFQDNNIVFIWSFFLLTFLPLLKVFYEQLHLIYAMIPLSILISVAIKKGVLLIRIKRVMFYLVSSLILVCLIGHATNIFNVRKGTRHIYSAIFRLSEYFSENLPANSIVISNIHHLEDIRYYSNGHFDPWSAPGAIFNKKKWIGHTPADLQKFIIEHSDDEIYFLDGRKVRFKGQLGGSRGHSFADKGMIETKSFGIIDKVSFVYPYFDPLRTLLPVSNTEWIGPPDLEFDFYRGPAIDGAIMFREIAINYFFYKVTGKTVYKWSLHPELLAGDVHNYNIVGFRNHVYAIPQNEGSFELDRIERGEYSKVFEGTSKDEVKEKIEAFVTSDIKKGSGQRWPVHPQLLEQNVLHFNIVGFKNRVYAIPQSEGAFEVIRFKNGGYSQTFEGETLDKVRSEILETFSTNSLNNDL
jgi:hypothetical protein